MVAFKKLPKTKIYYPTANSGVLEWESNTFVPMDGELNPKKFLNKTVGWISRAHPPFLLKTT
jgi:hypothetical protein